MGLLNYLLTCPSCGKTYKDDGLRTGCDICSKNGKKVILKFTPFQMPQINKNSIGIDRYSEFFPIKEILYNTKSMTKTYKSKGFAERHGLNNLYFTVTGYNKKLGIEAITSSFKELEAVIVLNRLKSFSNNKPLLLSSAGNTARAFAYYAAKMEYPVIIVTPVSSRRYLWIPDEEGIFDKVNKYVKTIFVDLPGKYLHASMLAKNIYHSMNDNIINEGGFCNVGRSVGLGMSALEFYDETGIFPDHYVQAVGSGSGPLSVLNMYQLVDKEKASKIKFHLVQNYPYIPLVEAIEEKNPIGTIDQHKYIDTVCSPMLTSGDPAYNYPGGIYQYMQRGIQFNGYSVTNREIYKLQYEMWRHEKIQILLPAAAALAGLLKGIKNKQINKDDVIQLNITGCGDVECRAEKGSFYLDTILDSAVPENFCYEGKDFNKWFQTVQKKLV